MLTDKIRLEPDEKLLAQVRKHWFILFREAIGVVVAAFLPLLLYVLLDALPSFSRFTETVHFNNPVIIAGYATWLLIIWMVAFNLWTNYYLDIWAITNKRLVVVDQRRLFHRETSSFRLERLQDMSVSFNGIIETFLDFGTLEADTASGEDKFRATGLPHPRELKALVIGAADEMLKRNQVHDAPQDGVS